MISRTNVVTQDMIDNMIGEVKTALTLADIDSRIETCVEKTVQDRLSGLALGLSDDIDLDTEKTKLNIEEFSRLREKWFLPLPWSIKTENGFHGVRWEHKRYITYTTDPIITRVDIIFYPNNFCVHVHSDEYKLTKVKELCTEWECTFQTPEATIVYILQLKDLGFIK